MLLKQLKNSSSFTWKMRCSFTVILDGQPTVCVLRRTVTHFFCNALTIPKPPLSQTLQLRLKYTYVSQSDLRNKYDKDSQAQSQPLLSLNFLLS